MSDSERTVFCIQLKREAPGLKRQPYPGALGEKIFNQVSQEAWKAWLRHQTILINEYRLVPIEPKARQFLEEQMEKFFFADEVTMPEAFKPQDA